MGRGMVEFRKARCHFMAFGKRQKDKTITTSLMSVCRNCSERFMLIILCNFNHIFFYVNRVK